MCAACQLGWVGVGAGQIGTGETGLQEPSPTCLLPLPSLPFRPLQAAWGDGWYPAKPDVHLLVALAAARQAPEEADAPVMVEAPDMA
jgi:hypothetical protein